MKQRLQLQVKRKVHLHTQRELLLPSNNKEPNTDCLPKICHTDLHLHEVKPLVNMCVCVCTWYVTS